ncbi:hypothetical protein FF38_11381 [Lucilia cuprina]|uniref:Methyltransferase domain-containing protein n=1 Tax=Lucilia cuprina TaxID=7375 RepID=A0A0L0C3C2_LUCCU|nr:hypothetical protein FF38_11381 [Lucilia cuprina]
MSLPKVFANSTEYFQQVNEFLKKYSWIYREANTGFLKADILNQMPHQYQKYFIEITNEELNRFPYIHEPLALLNDESIKNFRYQLNELIPPEAFQEPRAMEKTIKMENLKKMNIKKQHEIQRLAAVVKENLKLNENGNEQQEKYVLIDFGSGLGYLSELLYKLNRNILVLGLEADNYRVEAAEKRVKTFMPTANNSIQYRQQFITEQSQEFIVQTVEEVFKLNYQQVTTQTTTTKMAIIGLHACADLTITSLKLFLQMPQVQHLIIMPCCYHKLQVCDESAVTKAALKFRNFPLSESLKKVLLNNDDKSNYAETQETFPTYLNRPFLRLACQQTLKRWSKCSSIEHCKHGNEMFLRAVAELIKMEGEEVVEQELIVFKRKEETANLSSLSAEDLKSFDTFSRFYGLKSKSTNDIVAWSERHRRRYLETIDKYPNGGKLAEGLTCLQTSIQKLCENLVLYDRLCYMEETALKMNLKINVRYEKIMDEELSPRCYVLIAEKL